MEDISILLVEDNDKIRNELSSNLSLGKNIKIIGEAENGIQAVDKSTKMHPDLILMDITMPEMSGFEAAKIILKKIPYQKILFLTIHYDEEYIMESYRIGAKGYILKDAPFEELIHAIKLIYEGGKYYKPTIEKIFKQKQEDNIY